jgi:acyl CoA:acetate/3-ketoacid CoA transferase beta subunit
MDQHGNFNNLAFGQNHAKPRMRLPGSGGIPDVTVFSDEVYLYVPRHSKITFVSKLDFVSGLGRGAKYLITDLGQFDFANGRLRLTSIHPGETLERIQAKTGFAVEVAPQCAFTEPPTVKEMQLLREAIDPLGVRRLELLGGAARKEALREILEKESTL